MFNGLFRLLTQAAKESERRNNKTLKEMEKEWEEWDRETEEWEAEQARLEAERERDRRMD